MGMSSAGEGAWIRRILGGDRAASERFVTQHYASIYRFLRHVTNCVEDAEDLTQQTFAKAWELLPAFRGDSSLATWLHGIAYFQYTHWRRAKREHGVLDEATELVDVAAGRDMGRALDAILVRDALEQLAPEQRETIVLYYSQELSVVEVAAVTGVPEGTVRSRLHSGRRRLRVLLAAALGVAEETAKPGPATTGCGEGGFER